MDYGRFKYEQAKRDRDARKKQRVGDLKEVKMSPNIDDHDFNFMSRNAQRFLKEGNKVKFTIKFRGREIVHQDRARSLVTRFAEAVGDVGVIERPPRLEGRNMIAIIAPTAQVMAEARATAARPASAPASAPAPAPTPGPAPARVPARAPARAPTSAPASASAPAPAAAATPAPAPPPEKEPPKGPQQ